MSRWWYLSKLRTIFWSLCLSVSLSPLPKHPYPKKPAGKHFWGEGGKRCAVGHFYVKHHRENVTNSIYRKKYIYHNFKCYWIAILKNVSYPKKKLFSAFYFFKPLLRAEKYFKILPLDPAVAARIILAHNICIIELWREKSNSDQSSNKRIWTSKEINLYHYKKTR